MTLGGKVLRRNAIVVPLRLVAHTERENATIMASFERVTSSNSPAAAPVARTTRGSTLG